MKTMTKAFAATAAAGALAVTSATPAVARDHDDGIDAGDIIAGALIIGGIAAVAGAIGDKDRDGYRYGDRRYRDRDYNPRKRYRRTGRRAVEKCVRAAQRDARRAGYRYANVTQIRDVDDRRYGWRIKGRIEVDGARGYGKRYRNGWHRSNYDRRGYGNYGYGRDRGYDRGKFTCYVERGRVTEVDFKNIRGLR